LTKRSYDRSIRRELAIEGGALIPVEENMGRLEIPEAGRIWMGFKG
jgi:hypothetical protein